MRSIATFAFLLLLPACSCFSALEFPGLRKGPSAQHPEISKRSTIPAAGMSLGRRAVSLQQSKDGGTDTSDVINTVMSNTMEGEMGKRGELYVGLQFGLIFLVVFGPAFTDFVESTSLLAGLALCAGGLGMGFLGAQDLGSNLTPWVKPIEKGTLQRDGVYGIVRHPLYGSLVVTCLGLSILSLSFPRLLFTGMLYALLNAKSAREEEFLCETFADYEDYRKQVTDRLIPYASEASSLLRKVAGGN